MYDAELNRLKRQNGRLKFALASVITLVAIVISAVAMSAAAGAKRAEAEQQRAMDQQRQAQEQFDAIQKFQRPVRESKEESPPGT